MLLDRLCLHGEFAFCPRYALTQILHVLGTALQQSPYTGVVQQPGFTVLRLICNHVAHIAAVMRFLNPDWLMSLSSSDTQSYAKPL